MKKVVFVIITTILVSCNTKSKVDFKYADREQVIACSETNNALLNEALYSFEEDLISHSRAETRTLTMAYGQFMYKGIMGQAKYNEIVNNHSLQIRDALLESGILITTGQKSNLNYTHPAVLCIINNIENQDLKNTLNALLTTNSMNPALFNDRLRNFGRDAEKNRYQAMYVALEAYYQNLVGITLETVNE